MNRTLPLVLNFTAAVHYTVSSSMNEQNAEQPILNMTTMSYLLPTGMAYSREGTHGKMEFMALTVQSDRERTSLMFSKRRIRSVATSTTHHLDFRKLLEGSVASESGAVQGFQFPSLLLPGTSPYWLGTGSREINT
jgi:hypothetical protein